MARSVAMVFFTLCFLQGAFSQSTCPPNLDFELGNFSNWECFIGTAGDSAGINKLKLYPSAPMSSRHEIISASSNPGLDPYGGFPKVCPYGGEYSVKLGNTFTGAEAEGISYTFTVPTSIDTFTFTYFYAVVFEDPKHALPDQPRFFVTAYDVETGSLINCASYDYVSTSSLPGFEQSKTNSSVLFKDWTPTSLQFAGLGGHKVRLEFRTGDCTLGGHFGYAYMDVASACSNILATAPYCIETNSLVLNAPYGFQTYNWYNSNFSSIIGKGQSLTLNPPPATTGVFYVDVIPYPGFGCRDTLQAFVTPLPVPPIPDADTIVTLCQYESPPLLNAKVLPGHQLLWYTSPTGGTGTTTLPRPSTNAAGTFKFYVSQKALFGCEGFRREIVVNVIPSPVVSFSVNNTRQCLVGNNYNFSSTSTNLVKADYSWDFGNSQSYSSSNTFSSYTYSASGNFTVRLKITNSNRCSAEKTQVVTVVPKPVAIFSYPSLICESQTPVLLNDRSTVPGNLSTVNKWWWDINGKIVQTQTPSSFTAQGGNLPVKFVVTTTEGCVSDTNNITINIRYAPLPAFAIGDLLCDNEVIHLTDQSSMPANGINEKITRWYWTFDNSTTSITQNPLNYFNAGSHTVRLMAETGLGCKSGPLDRSFEIYPKPKIKLSINDSCVFVPLIFTAADQAGNVVRWDWNFGNGFQKGASSITMTYNTEGSRPFTLMTFTDRGCKDTIYRPFAIFDNKSFAGKDTVAAVGEPVQLYGRGEPNMQYTWSPSTGLNDPNIENPIAILDKDQLYKLTTFTEKGCKKLTQILIKRYNGPDLYVPSAFTPNNDGLNDKLKVFPVGIKSFGYLAVYDRWGQLMFRTANYHDGWDGTFKGLQLGTGTFVYIVQAIDYRGKQLVRKGTVTLIQ